MARAILKALEAGKTARGQLHFGLKITTFYSWDEPSGKSYGLYFGPYYVRYNNRKLRFG